MPKLNTFGQLKARYEELKSDRGTTENTWQEIADNLLGRRDFTVVRTSGEQRMQRIYDDTSKIAGSLLAGAIHSLLTNPSSKWFKLRFENPEVQENQEAAQWLDATEKRLYAAIGAPEANFHAQLNETYIDLINFGTGALFIDDVAGKGPHFSTRPLQELYLAEDTSGRIDTIVREFQFTARQAVTEWGDKAKSAQRSIDGNKSEDKQTYVHLVFPREDVAFGNIDVSGMQWSSFFISLTDSAIMDEGGYREMPFATPRWEKDAGEIYGRGPGWNALSNQKMLNEMRRVRITAGQLNVNPPKMVDSEGVLPGDLRFHPGAVIPVNSMMSTMTPAIQPVLLGGDDRMTTSDIIDTRKAVQDAFHHQLIELIRDPRMTATQSLELSAQMNRHLAPILGRMSTELHDPIIDRVFSIEERAGRLPPVPESIQGQPLEIDHVNPISRAQQTGDARAIIDFSGVVANLAAVAPEVLDVVDFDDGARKLGEALGVPPSMLRDQISIAKRREAAAEQAAQEEAMQQAVTATDQIAKLAKAAPQQGAA